MHLQPLKEHEGMVNSRPPEGEKDLGEKGEEEKGRKG
jgi:hypothetical protein